jgi:hypothetical protein
MLGIPNRVHRGSGAPSPDAWLGRRCVPCSLLRWRGRRCGLTGFGLGSQVGAFGMQTSQGCHRRLKNSSVVDKGWLPGQLALAAPAPAPGWAAGRSVQTAAPVRSRRSIPNARSSRAQNIPLGNGVAERPGIRIATQNGGYSRPRPGPVLVAGVTRTPAWWTSGSPTQRVPRLHGLGRMLHAERPDL